MNNILKKSLTESKFNMWRACISVIFLDNVVTPEEKKWVHNKIDHIPFSKDQKNMLIIDLNNGLNMSDILPKVTDKKDRAFLLHMVRVISYLDGNYSVEEKSTFKSLEKSILKNLDIPTIESQIKQMEENSYHKDVVNKVHNKHSIFESLIKSFIKHINIDG